MITIEYVDNSGMYEVCSGLDFFGAFEALSEAFTVASVICPAGEIITCMNLNDLEAAQVAIWQRLETARFTTDGKEAAYFQCNPSHAWTVQDALYEQHVVRGRGGY